MYSPSSSTLRVVRICTMPWSFYAFSTRLQISPSVLKSLCRFSTTARLQSVEDQSNFLEDFIQGYKPSQIALEHFHSVDWARKALEDHSYELVPFFSRHLNEYTGENRFFAQTVNTETTIPHVLSLRLKDLKTPEPVSRNQDQPSALDFVDPAPPPEVISLISLGRGLEAHPSIVHGGFQCVIFDEVMRLLILLHQNNICQPGPRDIHFTLNMSVAYSAPVITPSNVLVRSRLIRREGRKWFTTAEIMDGTGKILTSAESMWVTAKKATRS